MTVRLSSGDHDSGSMSIRRSSTGTLNSLLAGVMTYDGRSESPIPVNRNANWGSPTRIRTGVFLPIFPYSGDSGFRAEYLPSLLTRAKRHEAGDGDDWWSSRPRRMVIPWDTSTSGVMSLHWSSYQSSTWT